MGYRGRAFKAEDRDMSVVGGEIPSLEDVAAKVELFLFQGQKGDPGSHQERPTIGKGRFPGTPALRVESGW